PGPGFEHIGERAYAIHPSRREDFNRLLRELRERKALPNHIVHLWNITPPGEAHVNVDSVDAALEASFYSLLALPQALGDAGLTQGVHLAVISNGLHDVTGEEEIRPVKAALLGPVRVIPLEYPNVTCRSIDVALPASGSRAEERLVDQLLLEIS